MDGFVIFIVVIIVILVFAAWIIETVLGPLLSFLIKRRTAAAERAILSATGDPDITRLMMLLLEDLPYPSRRQQKIEAICARPDLARVAFLTALKTKDPRMQSAGILGLVQSNCTDSIVYLLELHRSSDYLRDEATEALLQLARMAPTSGPNGFLAIFEEFRTTQYNTAYALKTGIGYLERLLRIATERRAAFSDTEFEDLCQQAFSVSTSLISSDETRIRHIGEDFLEKVNRLRAAPKHHSAGTSYNAQESRSQYVGGDARSQQQWRRQGTEWPERAVYRPPDYYKILQVDPSAEPEVIAGAYRRLAAKYHPDKNNAPDANEKMQRINEAYEVLSNPIQRGRYDRARSLW